MILSPDTSRRGGYTDVLRVQAEAQKIDALTAEKPFFGNPFSGVGRGVHRGYLLGKQASEFALTGEADETQSVIRSLDPNFKTGTVEDIASEFTTSLSLYAVGAAAPAATGVGAPIGVFGTGPALLGSARGVDRYLQLIGDGVDAETAAVTAGITGLSEAALAVAPASIGGKTILTAAAKSAGFNVAIGQAAVSGEYAYLKSRGYDEHADFVRPLQAEQMVVDAALGAVIGGGAKAARTGKLKKAQNRLSVKAEEIFKSRAMAPGAPKNAAAANRLVKARAAIANVARLTGKIPDDVDVALNKKDYVAIEPDAMIPERASSEDVPLDDILADVRRGEAASRFASDEDAQVINEYYSGILDASGQAGSKMPAGVTEVEVLGSYRQARWDIVDADELIGQISKSDSQWRDRTRGASSLQIARIAANPDYRKLSDSPVLQYGAPAVLEDGTVIAGNGRLLGLQEAYSADPTRLQEYRQMMASLAKDVPELKARLESAQRPVLVRRLPDVENVREAAIRSNEADMLAMSPLERAKADASRLPNLSDVDLDDRGLVYSAATEGLFAKWLRNTPENETAAMVDSTGRMSKEGLDRLRNAIFYEAYGDSPVLQRLVEVPDPEAKNINAALRHIAPQYAAYKQRVQAGRAVDVDITEEIVDAVSRYLDMRAKGINIKDALDQSSLFGERDMKQMVSIFAENARSAKKITEFFREYMRLANDLGDPKQADMFGDAASVTAGDLMRQAARNVEQKAIPDIGPDVNYALALDPNMTILDENGSPVNAMDALMRTEDQYRAADLDGQVIKASAECFLRSGK